MCQTLMEIMEPVILKKGIQMTIDTLQEFGHGDAEIKTAIMKKYDISAEEVDGYY